MPNKPNSEFHKMLKQMRESRKEEMSKIFNRPSLISPMAFNIEVPKVKAPTFDLDLKSLNINSLLGDYFKENSLSETMKKAVSDNIKNINLDSLKLYENTNNNKNEQVVKMGDYKVSSYTTISRTTYVEMEPPKVISESSTEDIEPLKDETATAKDIKELTEYGLLLNEYLAFGFNGHSIYSIYYDGVIPIQFLVLIHTLHFIVAYLLVQKRHQQKLKIKEIEKE